MKFILLGTIILVACNDEEIEQCNQDRESLKKVVSILSESKCPECIKNKCPVCESKVIIKYRNRCANTIQSSIYSNSTLEKAVKECNARNSAFKVIVNDCQKKLENCKNNNHKQDSKGKIIPLISK